MAARCNKKLQSRFGKAACCQLASVLSTTLSAYTFQPHSKTRKNAAARIQIDDYGASERVENFPKRISRTAGASSSRRLPLAAESLAASSASTQVRGFLVVLVLVIGSTCDNTLHFTGSLDALRRSPVLFTSSIASPSGRQAVRGREAGRKTTTDEGNTR